MENPMSSNNTCSIFDDVMAYSALLLTAITRDCSPWFIACHLSRMEVTVTASNGTKCNCNESLFIATWTVTTKALQLYLDILFKMDK